jgi:hypothetical protein
LNELPFFYVVCGFPPDVMHEGVIQSNSFYTRVG